MDSLSSCHLETTVQFRSNLQQQISCVLDMLQAVRKMRVNIPEASQLAIQNLGDTSCQPAAPEPPVQPLEWQQKGSGAPFPPRRYSKAQGEEEDTFNTDEILQKFNNSMCLQQYQYRPIRNNLYETSVSDDEGSSLASKPFMNKYLKRRVSASDISTLRESTHLPLTPTCSGEKSDVADPPPGLISRYLGRRGSAGQILATMTYQAASGESSSSSEDKSKSLALTRAVSSSALGPQATKNPDVTDSSSSDIAPKPSSGGFGILSKTRQFGAWLTKATEGEKIEVTRTDLNTVAPTSF